MQRLLAFSSRFLFTKSEPAIWHWELQSDIEGICPRLDAAKFILLSIMNALIPSRYCKNLAQIMVEEAVKITSQISKVVETAEESLQLSQNISQLEEILFIVKIFVQSKSQFKLLLFQEDAFIDPSSLTARLAAILETFERNASEPNRSEDKTMVQKSSSDVATNQISRPTHRSSSDWAPSVIEANWDRDKGFSDRVSFFSGASNSTITGGTYFSIFGDYVIEPKYVEPSRNLQGIISGSCVITQGDLTLGNEIYKGHGYRLYTGKSSGKIVAVKVYEGNRARERCMEAAKFNWKMIHPNIPHMIAVSPIASEHTFLVLNGEYDGTLEYTLSQVLKKGLGQSLAWGLQTVIGLSSGLDYLQDQNFPFELVPALDHFILMTCGGKTIISFEPEYLSQTSLLDQPFSGALDIFDALCQKTFDAACQAHYESRQTERASIDEFEVEEDSSEEELPEHTDSKTTLPRSQKRLPSGRRQELIWKPSAETITLNEISRNFQYFVNANSSNSEPTLNRRRGRSTARTSHRCPGYNRIEITLTSDIERSAIVSHASPTPYEICPVCKEVVKDSEIFNCVCGEEDDESMTTVRCSTCLDWHHRRCTGYPDVNSDKYVCGRCKQKAFILAQRDALEAFNVAKARRLSTKTASVNLERQISAESQSTFSSSRHQHYESQPIEIKKGGATLSLADEAIARSLAHSWQVDASQHAVLDNPFSPSSFPLSTKPIKRFSIISSV